MNERGHILTRLRQQVAVRQNGGRDITWQFVSTIGRKIHEERQQVSFSSRAELAKPLPFNFSSHRPKTDLPR